MQSALGDRLRRRGARHRLVLPRWGWRAVFFVGVLPALFTLWIRRSVEEPAIWRAAQPSRRRRGLGLGDVFASGLAARSRSSLTLMNACTLFAWWGFNLWLPGYLSLPPAQGGIGSGRRGDVGAS